MCFDCPGADDQDICNLTIRFALRDQCCHLTFALSQPTKGAFGDAARRERMGRRNLCSCAGQEMLSERFVWDVGSEFLYDPSAGRKGELSFFMTLLGLIQFTESQ